MATSPLAAPLTFEYLLTALKTSGERLVELAGEAGMATRVPSCPAWDVRALVAHQAMVHRWATAHVRGLDPATVPNQTVIRTEVPDLFGYYRAGLVALADALDDAPADLVTITFLRDAPPPREFWARRQAHETTIHMVDALAATLQRLPTTTGAAIERALAADGIDELLCGFYTRGKCKLYTGTPATVLVAPDDIRERRWLLHVDELLTVERLTDTADIGTDIQSITGSAAGIYLGLWNRGDDFVATETDLRQRWRLNQRVTWR